MIPISQPSIGENEIKYVTDALKSGWVSSLGPYIEEFEKKFADYCGVEFALTTSNGTTGLHLALLAAGIQCGDEVIIPDLTFVATANAVSYIGAVPIFVDVDVDTLCISRDSIAAAITNKTKAIIPVHLYGQPADMDEINILANANSISVIEDAAEAHGAEYKGKRVGCLGQCGVFSFYGNKIITTGEGGMITTNSQKIFERAKILRDHAMSKEKRYWHNEVGYNYRMTNIQAAMGVAQMENIDKILKKRDDVIKWYKSNLVGCDRIRLNREISGSKSSFWLVCVEIADLTEETRTYLMQELRKNGIDSRPYFYPISDMPMYKNNGANKTPIAHAVSMRGINLPSFYDISDEQVCYICKTLLRILELV